MPYPGLLDVSCSGSVGRFTENTVALTNQLMIGLKWRGRSETPHGIFRKAMKPHLSAVRKYQLEHKKAGLCLYCSKPSFMGGVRCKKHMLLSNGTGSTIKRRSKWKAVDWSKPIKDIAKQLGVTRPAVYVYRKKHGL